MDTKYSFMNEGRRKREEDGRVAARKKYWEKEAEKLDMPKNTPIWKLRKISLERHLAQAV